MSNPTRIGQEAPDLKTPSSPSRITPTRALDDDAEHQMTKSEPPAPKYPYVVDEAGIARVGYVAVDPAQHNKATELQLWPLFGTKLTFARPHMRAFHFQWLSFFVAFMAWSESVWEPRNDPREPPGLPAPVARCVEINCNALHAIDAMLAP